MNNTAFTQRLWNTARVGVPQRPCIHTWCNPHGAMQGSIADYCHQAGSTVQPS